MHFSLASTIEYRTLFVSWFALRPLLDTYGLNRPANVLAVLLPLSLVFGSVVVAMAADELGLMRLKETYLSAVVGTGLALIYAGLVQLVARTPARRTRPSHSRLGSSASTAPALRSQR